VPQFDFGIKIGAENDTKSGITGALTGFRSFVSSIAKPISIPIRIGKSSLSAARSSLAFLRDFNLGVGGLARGAVFAAGKLDELLDAGLKFKPQLQSFESLTGKSGKSAIDMAKSLVAASNGTLTLASAIQIANRGLASGLGFDQIGTVLDFVSKKAVTTGKNAGQAVDTVVTGLARGSTLFLDDFGILVDGLEGVKRTFDSINGNGAFDSLGPAAQKAETVRQALVEMRQQIGNIGVTGKETFFVFEGIKNSLRSSVTRMLSMIANSEALRNVLVTVQGIVRGITQHFEGGGGFTELLLGKKGGKGGGLLGLGGAVMIDLGKLIGQGFMGVVLKSFTTIFQGLPGALRFIKDDLIPAIKSIMIDVGKEFGNEIRAAFAPVTADLKDFFYTLGLGVDKTIDDTKDYFGTAWLGLKRVINNTFGTDLKGPRGEKISMGSGMPPPTTPQGMLAQLSLTSALARVMTDEEERRFKYAKSHGDVVEVDYRSNGFMQSIRDVFSSQVNAAINPWAKAFTASQAVAQNQPTAPTGILGRLDSMADRVIDGIEKWSSSSFIGNLDKAADNLLDSAVAFKRTRAEFAKFQTDFSGKAASKAVIKGAVKQPGDDDIPLTQASRRNRRNRLAQIDRELNQIAKGNVFAGQQARERTRARIAKLRGEGRDVRPSDVRRIAQEEFDAVVRERSEPLRKERDQIRQMLRGDQTNRANRNFPLDPIPAGNQKIGDEVKKQTKAVESQTASLNDLVMMVTNMVGRVESMAAAMASGARRLRMARQG
jgi:hypothetical protein